MLKVNVALVGGLKAGAARRRSQHEQGQGLSRPHRPSLARSHKRIEPQRLLDGRALGDYIGTMFTGLVAVMGRLAGRAAHGAHDTGARLRVQARFEDGPVAIGESIAVDGTCLTVDALTDDGFEVDASAETLARTTLGGLAPGSSVHLERALRAGSLLGGHLVTGHVDCVATMVERRAAGEAVAMAFVVPPELARLIAEKGSVAVDGVSLTVNAAKRDRFDVMLIPHTLQKTKLGALAPGDPVNLEVDLVARYVARLLSLDQAPAQPATRRLSREP
jgi:riboflavin synthase